MTRGTSVFMPSPTNCLTSTASTSAGSIWLVEELHDPPQLGRDLVGDEEQPDPPRLEVRLDLLPELAGVPAVAQEPGQFRLGVEPCRARRSPRTWP